jgi:hypothetical protein
MLVIIKNFTKKATGRITFVCENGDLIERAIEESIATGGTDLLDEVYRN